MLKPKITIDTCVILPAYCWKRNSYLFMQHLDDYEWCLSEYIMDECKRILKNPKLAFFQEISKEYDSLDGVVGRINNILNNINEKTTLIIPGNPVANLIEDPTDNPILDCAYYSGSEFLITKDYCIRRLSTFEGTKIYTPIEFVSQYYR